MVGERGQTCSTSAVYIQHRRSCLSTVVTYFMIILFLFTFQEVIACNVLLPTVEMVCDPDYINQTIVMWVSC